MLLGFRFLFALARCVACLFVRLTAFFTSLRLFSHTLPSLGLLTHSRWIDYGRTSNDIVLMQRVLFSQRENASKPAHDGGAKVRVRVQRLHKQTRGNKGEPGYGKFRLGFEDARHGNDAR